MSWLSWRSEESTRIRALERRLEDITSRFEQAFERAPKHSQGSLVSAWTDTSESLEAELGRLRTNRLERKAIQRGINLHDQQDWWTTHEDEQGTSTEYLTDTGQAQANKRLRDDFRQSVQWWTDIGAKMIPLLTGLIGLVGTLIGLLALWRQ